MSRILDTIISHLLSFLKSNFVSSLRSHITFLLACPAFFFSLRLHELCSLSLSLAFALTRTLLLSCHACSSFFIASSPKSSRMDRLLWNPLSQDFLLFFVRLLAPRDQTLFVVGSETRETAALHSAK